MSYNLYKVKDHEEIVKDRNSGAILFADRGAADEYRAKKAMLQKTREMGSELGDVKAEVKELRTEMKEIKELLQRIASK